MFAMFAMGHCFAVKPCIIHIAGAGLVSFAVDPKVERGQPRKRGGGSSTPASQTSRGDATGV